MVKTLREYRQNRLRPCHDGFGGFEVLLRDMFHDMRRGKLRAFGMMSQVDTDTDDEPFLMMCLSAFQ